MVFLVKSYLLFLNIVYSILKLFKTRNQITLISRESNNVVQDFELLEKELNKELPDYKIVVLCKKMDNKLSYFFHVFRQLYNISRSKIVILDTYCLVISALNHKNSLKVIQIWHALGMMKKAGYAIIGKGEGRSKKISKSANMHKNYDYVFTSSNECIDGMSQVFNCSKNIIYSVPLPRIDIIKSKKHQEELKKKIFLDYPELREKINILYAPTLRKNEKIMQEKIKELMDSIDYNEYNFILKMHPLSKINISCNKAIIDKKYTTQDMLVVADYVVSDYSSMIYEAGILNKKLIFFAFDLDDYKDKRDFFIDYNKDLPGPIVKDGKELFNFIKNGNYNKYKDKNLISKYVDLSIDNYTKNMVNKIKEILKNEKL